MKLLIFLPFLGLVFLFCGITPAESAQDCLQHTVETCKNNNVWSDGGFCNAIYGNYQGNKQNLQKLMLDHFKQSFQFIVTGSYFKSDVVNRFGLSKTLMDYSDKMWNRGNKIMNFMLDRGAKVADFETALKLTNINPKDTNGEVKALGHTLSVLKSNAEDIIAVHKHANNKHIHNIPDQDSYDPIVMHFLQEELLEDYQKEIREVSGYLNILGKISKKDSTRGMGLHLFDQKLK